MSIGSRLRELRLKKGLTIVELAKILDSAKTTIANYETDKRNPSYDMLKQIADFYGVTVDYILGLTDNPNIYKEVEKIPEEMRNVGVKYLYLAKELEDKEIDADKIKQIIKLIEGKDKERP